MYLMSTRLRIWMPLAAVLVVLLSVAVILIYAVPATRARVSDYAQDRILAEATATGRAVAGTDVEVSRRLLELYVQANGGEALLVNREGETVVRAGNGTLDTRTALLRKASEGTRMVEDVGDLQVAIAPVIYRDELTGGVVLSSGDQSLLFRMSLRSGLEAAGIAAVLGGSLMFVMATLLARRIGRLASGARAIEQGDLGYRVEPGPDDELGELAGNFNSMAVRLENYVAWLEAEREARHVLLNSLTEGVVAASSEGGLLFANETARSMLGLGDKEELGDMPDPWTDFSLPDAVRRCALERVCGMARVENGKAFLQVAVNPLPGFDGGEDGVLVVMQDLAESRRLEADQQRFLGQAAHELKTPITAILGAAELLDSGASLEPEVRCKLLGYILSEGRRMQRLSDTMLRLARTGRDLREPELQEVDLVRVAYESAERIEPLAKSAGITVRVSDEGADHSLADPEWLDQALLILLNNAVQHSDKEGQVWTKVSGNELVVEDYGEGINPTDLSYVFESFYRGRQSSEGFGLGLPICKEMVERMGGSVSISSEAGVGTRVTIALREPGDVPTRMHRKE